MPGIDSYTKLCIVSDGTTGGETTFTDISFSAHTVNVEGGTYHDATDPLFGFTAIRTDSADGFLYIDPSDDWEFGTGDYTLQLRRKVEDVLGTLFHCEYFHSVSPDSWSSILLSVQTDGTVSFSHTYYVNSVLAGSRTITSTTAIDDSAYHDIELVRTGGVYKLAIDGTFEGSMSSSGTVASLLDNGFDSHTMYVLGEYGYSADALSDQIRISKGIARHTANFTPLDESFDDTIDGLCELDTPAVTLSSEGTFPTFGFCEFNTPAPWVDGIGYNPIIGYVEFDAPLPVITAANPSLGTGEFNTPAVSLTATGSFPIYAWTEFNTPKVVSDSAGDSQVFGFCEFNAPQALLFSESGGDVLMQTSAVSLGSTGVMAYPGFGELNTPRVVISSYGVQNLLATVSMTPPRVKLKAFSSIPAGYEVVKYRR